MDGFGGWGLPPILQIIRTGLGTTSGEGLVLLNDTPAAAGAQQISPRMRFSGYGWKENATAGSQQTEYKIELVPVQGAANPQARLDFNYQINGAGYQATPTLSLLDGNVGIGTTGPTGRLNVVDDSTSVAITKLESSSTYGTQLYLRNDDLTNVGDSWIYWGVNTQDWVAGIDNSDSDKFKIETGSGLIGAGTNVLTLQTNGNVGIGTEVFGTSAAKVLALAGPATAPTTSPADVVQLWSADINAEAGKASLMLRSEITANGNGAVTAAFIKSTTGDLAAGYEGMIQINTFDNTAKIWADGAWRAIATAW